MNGWVEFDRRAKPVSTEAFVTLQKKGMLSLNRAARDLLGNSKTVTLLYNQESNQIGIRPCSPDNQRAYPLRLQGSGSTSLIAGQAFTKFFGIDTEVARRYKATTVVDMLIVDLNQDAPVVTGPRSRD